MEANKTAFADCLKDKLSHVGFIKFCFKLVFYVNIF